MNNTSKREFHAYFLDVGQGDATLLFPPDNHAPILVDCRDAFVVQQTLRAWSIDHLCAFVISHLDNDHISGALELLASEITVERVYLSADRDVSRELPDHNRGYNPERVIERVIQGDRDGEWIQLTNRASPDPIIKGDDWSIRLLAPAERAYAEAERRGNHRNANLYSSIIRVEFAERALLIGADAPLVSWNWALQHFPVQVPAVVFRIPHHGGKLDQGGFPQGWDKERLYQEVEPDTAIISVGTQNQHDHPIPEWIAPICHERCNDLRCTQVTTRCQRGAKTSAEALHDSYFNTITQAATSPSYEPFWRHYQDQGWQDAPQHPWQYPRRRKPEVPCAGTILLTISEDGTFQLRPERAALDEVIEGWSHPLCKPIPADEEE